MSVAAAQLPGYLTVAEVADDLDITPSRVRQLLMELRQNHARDVGYLIGRTRLFRPSDVKTLKDWRKRVGQFKESD